MQKKKTRLSVSDYAKQYTSKHGGACHRNNVYYLIKTKRLPEGHEVIRIKGQTLIAVPKEIKPSENKELAS